MIAVGNWAAGGRFKVVSEEPWSARGTTVRRDYGVFSTEQALSSVSLVDANPDVTVELVQDHPQLFAVFWSPADKTDAPTSTSIQLILTSTQHQTQFVAIRLSDWGNGNSSWKHVIPLNVSFAQPL